jgi:hypothetical protein
MFLAVEPLQRSLAVALATSMAQQHQAVVISQSRWIVGELERPDSPGVDAGAPQQVLTDERSVIARPCADQKDARAPGEPGYRRRRWPLL